MLLEVIKNIDQIHFTPEETMYVWLVVWENIYLVLLKAFWVFNKMVQPLKSLKCVQGSSGRTQTCDIVPVSSLIDWKPSTAGRIAEIL